jgi:glycosyltransferase involved in cell wall biosynthesis
MSQQRPSPHVVMLLLNPFTHDSRVEKEARTLLDAGYRVTVVAPAAEGLPRRELRSGVDVIRVRRPGWPPLLRFFLVRRRMARVAIRLRPDAIHAHDTETLEIAGRAAAALQVPIVYDGHELWLERVRRGRSAVYAALTNQYFATIEHRWLPRVAARITVSEPIAEHLRRRYGVSDIIVLPNYPMPVEPPEPPWQLRRLPGASGVPAGAPIVLFIGNATEGRGIEELMAAMEMLPGAHLVLLGAADQEDYVRPLARRHGLADRVHVTPRVPTEHVVAYAASATVGMAAIPPVSLSYRYSLPNKLFQCMQAGLPVVASDFAQVREIVEGAGAGITVDPLDARAIAAAIRTYLDDPARRRADGERGRVAVRERFNWTEVAPRLLEVYRQLVPLTEGP